jgi:hypothetical protein
MVVSSVASVGALSFVKSISSASFIVQTPSQLTPLLFRQVSKLSSNASAKLITGIRDNKKNVTVNILKIIDIVVIF